MVEPAPPPGKGKQNPDSKGHDGRAAKPAIIFSPNVDIRGGNVVKRTVPSTVLGRAPLGAPPQQPTSQNHFMGEKGKAQSAVNKAELSRQVAARMSKEK